MPFTRTDQKAGLCWRFYYPTEFSMHPDYTAHAGQIVLCLRKCTPEEADGPDVDPSLEQMYHVRAHDGWEGDAYDSELGLIVSLSARERDDWPGLGDFPVTSGAPT